MSYGLILGGGTALGAVQVPILRHLYDTKGPPAWAVGVSVGSLNAAFCGEDRLSDLEELWGQVDGTRFFQVPNLDPWNGLFSMAPLRKKLRHHAVAQKLKLPTYAGIVDLSTGAYRNVHLNGTPLQDRWDVLIASCTQTGIHERVRWNGNWWGDGGLRHVLPPVPEGLLDRVEEVHAISCSPVDRKTRFRKHDPDEIKSGPAQLGAAFGIVMGEAVLNDVDRLKTTCGEKLRLWAPHTWDQVGQPFKAKQDDIALRLRTGRKLVEEGPLYSGASR